MRISKPLVLLLARALASGVILYSSAVCAATWEEANAMLNEKFTSDLRAVCPEQNHITDDGIDFYYKDDTAQFRCVIKATKLALCRQISTIAGHYRGLVITGRSSYDKLKKEVDRMPKALSERAALNIARRVSPNMSPGDLMIYASRECTQDILKR